MGSKFTRQSSHDMENKLSKRRGERHDGSGEAERSAGRDFLFTSLMLKSDKLPGMLRKTNHSPYVRRAAWIRDIQKLLREHRVEQAGEVLTLLKKDLGLQGTSLNDVLYKNAAFLNLVDPISHELLLNLAKDLQVPKREAEALRSSEKICRQLIYHLTPHSKWTRQSVPRTKTQACLKTTLKTELSSDVVNLSGIPLSGRDVQRVGRYLQSAACSASVSAVDLSFASLRDESLSALLPSLASLPRLTTLALNGNRLTAGGVLKELAEQLKDPRRFPRLAWVDLGNNVDIVTVPQPLLVALRRRYGLRSSLPTIYESHALCLPETSVEEEEEEERAREEEEEEEEEEDKLELEAWGVGEERFSESVALRCCER